MAEADSQLSSNTIDRTLVRERTGCWLQGKVKMVCRRSIICSMMRTRPLSGALHGHPTVLLPAVPLHSCMVLSLLHFRL